MTAAMNPHQLPESLLSRVEDAGINASAPPQQRWIDGWLVRFSPGKAKRARCVQAVAVGRLPLDERLALCAAVLRDAGLPLVLRLTPFSQPAGLDQALASRGFQRLEDTRVMVLPVITDPSGVPAAPADRWPDALRLDRLSAVEFAAVVGGLRGSPAHQRAAQAERLALSPVPYQGWALRRRSDGAVLACGQTAIEADLVGLYDVFSHPEARGQGLARQMCAALLAQARAAGARLAYLQVDADNAPARAIYHRLGFADVYAYHYRSPKADAG